MTSPGTQQDPTRLRLWAFRLVTVLFIPALLLGALEVAFRVMAPGHSTRLTTRTTVNGEVVLRENPSFAWQYFPAEIAREPLPLAFPARKAPQTFRVFVLGASAAQGDPEPTYGFSRILEWMLARRHPDLDFEVINTAVTAVNSHAVYRVAKEVAPLEADLFIIYVGNNEVVGPYGAGTVFAPLSPNLAFIRFSSFLKASHLGQGLARGLRALKADRDDAKEWRGMEMFLDQQVRADDPGLELVYSHFRSNLEDTLGVIHEAGAATILSTVATNLRDSPPFASLHRPSLSDAEQARWQEDFGRGVEFLADGRVAAARTRFEAAEAIDASHATLQFLLGRCDEELGDVAEAERRYRLAQDLDTLRFRADSRINAIVRNVAADRAAEGVVLVDAAKAIETNSSHGLPGSEFFVDHVHLSFAGNYLLAKALLPQVEALLPAAGSRSTRESGPAPTLEECIEGLAFTGFDRHRVAEEMLQREAKPPFTNQFGHQKRIEQARRREGELRALTTGAPLAEAIRRYEDALRENGDDPWLHYNFAMLLYAAGRFEAASEQFETLLAALPQHRVARERLLASLAYLGRTDEVVAQSRAALRLDPDFDAARYSLASALARTGRQDESIAIYRELLQRDRSRAPDILNALGQLHVQRSEYSEAVEAFSEGASLSRDAEGGSRPDLLYNLGVALKRGGRAEEADRALSQAISAYHEKIRATGGSAGLHFGLGNAYVEMRDFLKAGEAFRAATRFDPADFDAHTNLARSLEAQGRLRDAVQALQSGAEQMLRLGQRERAQALLRQRASLEAKLRVRGGRSAGGG